MSHAQRKCCRAVVITTDGKRHLTRWKQDTWAVFLALKAGKKLAERRKLSVKQIDVVIRNQKHALKLIP